MGLFSSVAGAAATSNPYGAAAQYALDAAQSPVTSRSGDIKSTGASGFNPTISGLNFGTQVPSWVWIAGIAALAVFLLKRK